MPSTIIKPKPKEDFYVVWSTVVDAATYWGTRAELEAEYRDGTPERFARADQHGTSALWGSRAYGWVQSNRTLMLGEDVDHREGHFAILNIDDLREWCESYRNGKFTAVHLITWKDWNQ